MRMVFHYAPWAYLPAMVESACLRPTNAGGAAGEAPLLWFSANPRWEPTATKLWQDGAGVVRKMSFRGQLGSVGCIRFALAADSPRLMPWKLACATAAIGRNERRALARTGKKLGADPAHWFAMATSVPLAELALEVLLDEAWHPASPGEMAQVWAERHPRQYRSS